MQFEILAPAGSMESLIAGVRCGAHAVYLGGQTFNARRGAGNFSPQELQAAVQYCHTRGVKVYMTLNTLVMLTISVFVLIVGLPVTRWTPG